jgi:hypothetical protein
MEQKLKLIDVACASTGRLV